MPEKSMAIPESTRACVSTETASLSWDARPPAQSMVWSTAVRMIPAMVSQ